MNESNRLTDAEWKIMRLLWENPPLMQLTHALEEETGWSKHTVIALLKRMMEKGTVRAAKAGAPSCSTRQLKGTRPYATRRARS